MSTPRRARPLSAVTLVAVLTGVAAMVALLGVSGAVLPAQQPAAPTAQPAVVGRQVSVCPVDADTRAGATVRLGAVVAEGARPGRLVGQPLGPSAQPVVDLGRPGSADAVTPNGSVVLRTEGGFSAASAAGVLTRARTGPAGGLSTLTCQTPGTSSWFPGVAATADQSTRLLLTNPDRDEAEVDLHFYGANGPVGAPGSLGIVVPSASTRTIALTGLLPDNLTGPVAVVVTTSRGRVSAYAQSTYRNASRPAGEAWAQPMPAPQTSVVLAGVPGGTGARDLVLTNPSIRRASVRVEVLGANGRFAPADRATVDVGAESTATAPLAGALDGEAVAVRLTSTEPIGAAMVSTSARSGAAADVAVQPAATPVRGLGLQPYAFADGDDAVLLVSNDGDAPARVRVTARTFDYAVAGQDDLTVEPGATATVALPGTGSGLVEVRTRSTQVYAGTVLTGSGEVAGLATGVVATPVTADAGGQVSMDPRTGTGDASREVGGTAGR